MARRDNPIRRALAASQRYRLARKRLSDARILQHGDMLELSVIAHTARNEYREAMRQLQP